MVVLTHAMYAATLAGAYCAIHVKTVLLPEVKSLANHLKMGVTLRESFSNSTPLNGFASHAENCRSISDDRLAALKAPMRRSGQLIEAQTIQACKRGSSVQFPGGARSWRFSISSKETQSPATSPAVSPQTVLVITLGCCWPT